MMRNVLLFALVHAEPRALEEKEFCHTGIIDLLMKNTDPENRTTFGECRKKKFPVNTNCPIFCAKGYKLKIGTNGNLTCKTNGEFTYVVPQCIDSASSDEHYGGESYVQVTRADNMHCKKSNGADWSLEENSKETRLIKGTDIVGSCSAMCIKEDKCTAFSLSTKNCRLFFKKVSQIEGSKQRPGWKGCVYHKDRNEDCKAPCAQGGQGSRVAYPGDNCFFCNCASDRGTKTRVAAQTFWSGDGAKIGRCGSRPSTTPSTMTNAAPSTMTTAAPSTTTNAAPSTTTTTKTTTTAAQEKLCSSYSVYQCPPKRCDADYGLPVWPFDDRCLEKPDLRSPCAIKSKQCVFPFTVGNKKYDACYPDRDSNYWCHAENGDRFRCLKEKDPKLCIDNEKNPDEHFAVNHPVLYTPGILNSNLYVEQAGEDKCSRAYPSGSLVWPIGSDVSDMLKLGCFSKIMKLEEKDDGEVDGENGWKLRSREGMTESPPSVLKEYLEAVGYKSGSTFKVNTVDWRLNPVQLETRDGFFTNAKKTIDEMYEATGKSVVLVNHSYGGLLMYSLLQWATRNGNADWVKTRIHASVNIAAPFLGSHEAVKEFHSKRNILPDYFLETKRSWTGSYLFIPQGGNTIWGSRPVVTLYSRKKKVIGELDIPQFCEKIEDEGLIKSKDGHVCLARDGVIKKPSANPSDVPIYNVLEQQLPPLKLQYCFWGSGHRTTSGVKLTRKRNKTGLNLEDFKGSQRRSQNKYDLDGDEYVSSISAGYPCHLWATQPADYLSDKSTKVTMKEYTKVIGADGRTVDDDIRSTIHTQIYSNRDVVMDILRIAATTSSTPNVQGGVTPETMRKFKKIDERF